MKTPAYTIIKMDEGEARIRTAWERLYEARNQLGEARFLTLDFRLEDQAEEYWKYYLVWNDQAKQSALANIEKNLDQNGVPQAKAIGHTVGYRQY